MNTVLLLSLLVPIATSEAVLSETSSAERQTLKLAVMEIRVTGVESSLGEVVEELLATQTAKTGRYSVIGRDDIKRLLDHEGQKQMLECPDADSCLAELGGALGVDLLLAGSLTRVDQTVVIALKLIDVHKATVIQRDVERVQAKGKNGGQVVLDGVQRLHDRMFGNGTSLGVATVEQQDNDADVMQTAMVVSAIAAAALVVLGGGTMVVGNILVGQAVYLVADSASQPVDYAEVKSLDTAGNIARYSGGGALGLGVICGAAAAILFFLLPENESL